MNFLTWTTVTQMVAYPNIRGTQQWRPCGYPKVLAESTEAIPLEPIWVKMKGNMAQGSDSPRTPLARTSWKSCTRFVLKIKSELGLFTFLPINLEVGIENKKRVKSVPQASLGGQSVKCSGRTNEPPEKFTFYFAHAKATPRNAKARHGRAHLLKLPKTPPTHLTLLGHLCS